MDNPVPRTYKRRIYFIEKSFQAKFILKFCALVVLGGLFTIGLLYLLAMQSTTVSFVNSRVVVRTTADFILPVLIQTVAVITVIVGFTMVIVTLLVSHKIAGPLYRLKKVFQELEGGDLSHDFHIRHLDQLQNLADAFDSAIRRLRQKIQAVKDSSRSLGEELNGIQEGDIAENKRELLGKIKKTTEELNKTTDYFKTSC